MFLCDEYRLFGYRQFSDVPVFDLRNHVIFRNALNNIFGCEPWISADPIVAVAVAVV